ncbi:MAG: biotin transporter BioY [Rhodospirillaceae bacterium]|nr:biotin transporter BioY [Rhodospirillaceae bacterium]
MNSNKRAPKTIAAALWPAADEAGWRAMRAVLLALVGSLVIAVSAQFQVPMYPVPMTMQTFAVVVIGAAYGARLGFATVLLYLAEGAIGLPVFAGMKGGAIHLLGPTGGYLVGFALAAGVVGWLADRGWDRGLLRTAFAMFAGHVVIFALGLGWLAHLIGAAKAIEFGFVPFVPGLFLKVALAVAILPGAWRLIGRARA